MSVAARREGNLWSAERGMHGGKQRAADRQTGALNTPFREMMNDLSVVSRGAGSPQKKKKLRLQRLEHGFWWQKPKSRGTEQAGLVRDADALKPNS